MLEELQDPSSGRLHIPWDEAGCLCPVGDLFNYVAPDDKLCAEESLFEGKNEKQFSEQANSHALRLTDGGYEEDSTSYCFYAKRIYKKGDGAELQSALAVWTGQRVVSNIFIGGNHIGGKAGSFKSSTSSGHPLNSGPLPLPPLAGSGLRNFTYEEIVAACQHFSADRWVSEGISSTVYKATFGDDLTGLAKLEATVTTLFMSLPEDLKVRWITTSYKNHSE